MCSLVLSIYKFNRSFLPQHVLVKSRLSNKNKTEFNGTLLKADTFLWKLADTLKELLTVKSG